MSRIFSIFPADHPTSEHADQREYYRFWFPSRDIEVPEHSENLSFSFLFLFVKMGREMGLNTLKWPIFYV